jgi:hypothetical protein
MSETPNLEAFSFKSGGEIGGGLFSNVTNQGDDTESENKNLYPLISGSPLINFCQGQIKAREMLVQEGQTERAIVSFEFIYYFRT